MELKLEDCSVYFFPESRTVFFKGAMRLASLQEYEPISELLNRAAEVVSPPHKLVIDVTALQFLNSSGITMISLFVIAVRNSKKCQLAIRGSRRVAWQSKSLGNFKRLWDDVELSNV